MSLRKILLLEPFYGGSHKVLMDLLLNELQTLCKEAYDATQPLLITMTAKKWHWRARTSALHFAQEIPKASAEKPETQYGTIFCSSVLPLHELIAVRDDLRDCRKVIYFHENQLVYPVRKTQDRDFQYGYNQVMSCLAADVVLFNSAFNKESFLSSINKFFRLQPDYRPKNLREQIEPKCEVLYFPMNFAAIPRAEERSVTDCVSIVWPHRWEFDKNPELFFRVISRLLDDGVTNFRLNVLGENFTNKPPVFEEARLKMGMYIDNFGYLESKADYYGVLNASDVVISTAEHEFFGVAIMEAIYCGCYPLCPNKLVYPEILKKNKQCLYDSEDDLYRKLKDIISDAAGFKQSMKQGFGIDFCRFDWQYLKEDYMRKILPRAVGDSTEILVTKEIKNQDRLLGTMNNQGYSPYMYGANNGYQGNQTYTNNTSSYNVRDCMYWPASIGQSMSTSPRTTQAYSPSFNNRGDSFSIPTMPLSSMDIQNSPFTFVTGVTENNYGTGEPQMQQPPPAPVKAFIATGDGGSAKGIPIPCHMGTGPGQVPQMPSMQPMGYKVVVPPVEPTPPVDFEIKQ